MNKLEYEMLESVERKEEEIICAEDLKPNLKDRTLLYGYTCERETFHVYIKDKEIHVVVYYNDYSSDKVKPKNMREISFEVDSVSGNILSLTVYDFSYSAGAAHGYTLPVPMMFDLRTGELIRLSEMIADKDAVAEKYITIAKDNSLASKRQVMAFVTKEDVVYKLFNEIAPKYSDKNGGYTRITKIGPRRGDAAEMAIIELL